MIAVGRQIGLGYRRSVGLAVDLHGGTVDGEDGRTRPDHDVGQRFDQRRGGIAVEWTCLIHELKPICCSSCLTIAAPCWQQGAAQCIKPISTRDS